MKRQEKIVSADDAAALIKDGSTIVLGGFLLQNKPMAVVRSMIRRGVKDLFLAAGPSSIDVDMLVGAKCVRKFAGSLVSFEKFLPAGPRFRKAVQQEELELVDSDQGILCTALKASAMGLPFLPTRIGLGSDFLKINPGLKLFQDPFKGETLVAVSAIEPDIAIVMVTRSDPYGNSQYDGLFFFDPLVVQAAEKVIVVAEEIVAPDVITSDPRRTVVGCERVIGVVEAPYGAHPTAGHGRYSWDEDGITEYLVAARTDETFQQYLDKYVRGPGSHEEYLEFVGAKRLMALHKYDAKRS